MRFQLRTRKDIQLVDRGEGAERVVLAAKREGPRSLRDGQIRHATPDDTLVALLVLLALAGPAGMETGDLLLYLTPDLTRENGKAELKRLASALDAVLNTDGAVTTTPTGLALRPELVELDVRIVEGEVQPDADFLAAFDISNSPELAEWIERMRRHVVPVVDAERPTTRHRSRKYVALGAAVVVLSAAGMYIAAPHAVSGFNAGDPLIVADIQNQTGDSLLGLGVATAATVSLQQSSHVQLYPRARVRTVYRLMKLPNLDTALSFSLAREVAQRDRVRFVLGLEIAPSGGRYRVTANLADVAGDRTVYTMMSDASSKADVLSALDRVLTDTRRRLGESRRDIADRRLPLPLVTTPSLEALRSYAEDRPPGRAASTTKRASCGRAQSISTRALRWRTARWAARAITTTIGSTAPATCTRRSRARIG